MTCAEAACLAVPPVQQVSDVLVDRSDNAWGPFVTAYSPTLLRRHFMPCLLCHRA